LLWNTMLTVALVIPALPCLYTSSCRFWARTCSSGSRTVACSWEGARSLHGQAGCHME
jgi:hypothetical protein